MTSGTGPTNGTGTTQTRGQGPAAMPGTAQGLLELSAREAQAAHRGTDAILSLLKRGGGEDPDDPMLAIVELLMLAEEREETIVREIAAIRTDLGVLGEHLRVMRQELSTLLGRIQVVPARPPGAGSQP